MAGDAVYVYGVVADGGPVDLPAGVDGAAASLHGGDGLAAIVSAVPDGPVQATRRNLEAHAAVLAAALEQRDPVLPMRFGVLLPDEAAVGAELLGAARVQLEELLARFAGTVEFELKALYADQEALLEEVVRSDPRIAGLRGRGGYHEQLELGELVAARLEQTRQADEARLLERLRPFALAYRARGELPERVAAKLSFLVERGRQEELEAQAEQLATECHPRLQLRLDGPLPPHNFVDVQLPAGAAA
jgi:Gas vesicle synthesis protein GvpL/GvpF